MEPIALVFDEVSKLYGRIRAVGEVSFTVKSGECFGLLGPNGAGKSTLVKMLLGFVRPTSGQILIQGMPWHLPKARAKLGYLSENHCIPPFLTGMQYLKRHAELMGLERGLMDEQVERVLHLTKMIDRAKSPARTYSKGMTQRVGLAAALLGSPHVLVLDEPASGLDPVGVHDFRHILEQLSSQGTTILVNSHMLSEIEKTCDTYAIINKGNIVDSGLMTNLREHNKSLEDAFLRLLEEQ